MKKIAKLAWHSAGRTNRFRLAQWCVRFCVQRMHFYFYDTTRWCNGSTRDFGSLCLGSNPSRVITKSLHRLSYQEQTELDGMSIEFGSTSVTKAHYDNRLNALNAVIAFCTPPN